MAGNNQAALVLAALKERGGERLEELTEVCSGTYLCRLRGGEVLMARVSPADKVELHRMESST